MLYNFLVRTLQYLKKYTFFFAPENHPQNLLIIGPDLFFFCTGLAAQTAQKQKYSNTKSPLMQDWVFRLGGQLIFLAAG